MGRSFGELQFLGLFDAAIDNAPKAELIKDRVQNITVELTRRVYRYINRGLFERDKSNSALLLIEKQARERCLTTLSSHTSLPYRLISNPLKE